MSQDAGYTAESPLYRRITIGLFLAGLATFATLYCTQPLLPVLSAHFHVSPAESALSVSLTTISLGVSLLIVGPISDAVGRLVVMVSSLIASGVVTIATALVTNWALFLTLRCLLGVVVAGLPAVAVAYLREEMHPGAAARATGVYIGGTALGGMAGRLITAGVTEVLDWRWAIATIGAIALACGISVQRLLPHSLGFRPHSLDIRELAAHVGAIMRDPVLVGLQFLAFAAMGSFVAVFNTMGFRLADAPYHLSIGVAGLVFIVYVFGSWSSARAGRLVETYGPLRVAQVGLVIAIAGLLVTALRPIATIMLGLALLTIGFFAAHGVASGWVAARAIRRSIGAGQAASMYLFAYYLGSSVVGAVSGVAWSRAHWSGVLLLTVSLLVAALLVTIPMIRADGSRPPRRHADGML